MRKGVRDGLLFLIGMLGFILCLNEQPPGEVQNWWVNLIGLVLFGGAVAAGNFLQGYREQKWRNR